MPPEEEEELALASQRSDSTEEELQEPLLQESSSSPSPPLTADANDASTTSTNDNRTAATAINKDITLPCFGRVNHNVALNLTVCLFFGLSDSLWDGTPIAAYLKKLGHDRNGPLGDIEAVGGLASLVTALPIGYLADKIGRSKVIAAGSILMLLTIFSQAGLMEWIGPDETAITDQHRILGLYGMAIVMICWGIAGGVINGPASALFADSIPEGQRSTYYNYLFGFYMIASAVGPVVSIILFQTLGDDWDLYDLKIVIYAGLGLSFFTSFLMMFFDDKKALEHFDAPGGTADTSSNQQQQEAADPDDEEQQQQSPLNEQDEGNQNSEDGRDISASQKWIPYIIFIQGLIFALGSGMTVKFFPLFFKDEVGMSPSQVQVIYVSVPIAMVLLSTVITKLASAGFGRVQAKIVFSIIGVSCLYSMVVFKTYLDMHPIILVPIYILRTSLMNCSYPLQESILMDFVPPQQRARWKSLESISAFGWCGSAAFGGWLADKYDYTYTFAMTAIIQTVAIAVWSLLLPLVPRKEGSHRSTEEDEGRTTETDDAGSNNSLSEPLLSSASDEN